MSPINCPYSYLKGNLIKIICIGYINENKGVLSAIFDQKMVLLITKKLDILYSE